jgi:ubiquinone/menaquinone biosynthesis C-methylase UbiE
MTSHTDMERKELPMPAKPSLYGRARFFFRRYVVHGRVRIFLQWMFAKFQSLFIQPTILPYFITFFPFRRTSYSYKLPKTTPRAPGQELPHPPERLWLGYGKTIEEYLDSGRRHVATMRGILADSGFTFEAGQRALEMGCAGARMLRCLHDVSDRCEIWGTDISGEHIMWCKQHLTPPFHFCLTTQHAHMPFADGYFDLIYAASVFTHIDDLADAWMLELRRILKPGGRMYITIHDEHSIRTLMDEQNDNLVRTLNCRRDYFEKGDYNMFTIGRFMRSQVFYDSAYLSNRWRPFFDVQVHPGAAGFQTAYLLTKRS